MTRPVPPAMAQRSPPSWLNDVQSPPRSLPRDTPRPQPLLFDAENRPITTLEAWTRRRLELKTAWRAFLGTIPDPDLDPQWHVEMEDRPPGVVRQLVTYQSERGQRAQAYLLRPDDRGRDRPACLVLHSTVDWTIRQPAGLEGKPELFIALHLRGAGLSRFARETSSGSMAGPVT